MCFTKFQYFTYGMDQPFLWFFFCLLVLSPHFVSLFTFLHCYYSHLIFQAQVSVAMTLASMRYDSLFDYGTSLPDTKGGEVVQKYYKYLHTSVKSILQRRNAERFERGYLPYPYLVPGWIANSVHTWSSKNWSNIASISMDCNYSMALALSSSISSKAGRNEKFSSESH